MVDMQVRLISGKKNQEKTKKTILTGARQITGQLGRVHCRRTISKTFVSKMCSSCEPKY